MLNDFSRNRQTASDLLALMRFPTTQEGIDVTKAAEVFDVSLRMIECCVKRGMKLKKFRLQSEKASAGSSLTNDLISLYKIKQKVWETET